MKSPRRCLFVAGLFMLGLGLWSPAFCADPIPLEDLRAQGPLAAAAAEYLAAFNANDADALLSFVTTYRDKTSLERTPPAVRVQRQQQYRGMLGEVSLRAIRKSEDTVLELVIHAEKPGGYFQFSLETSSLDPLKISSMGLKPTAEPMADGADPLASAATLAEAVEVALETFDLPALAVAVGDLDGSLDVAVRGVRDLDTGDPAQPDDGFHIGSLTKSMTASIAARLVARGDLSWEETLGERLDDVAMDPGYRDVTLTQLLQHRASIEPLLNVGPSREMLWRAASTEPAGQRLALLGDVLATAPATAPGTGFAYSNAGYVAAAAMIERAAGTPWETLIAEEVFAPLDLATAGLGWPAVMDGPPQPRGYIHDSQGRRLQPYLGYSLAGALAPAGDVHCSVGDLARYGLAHLAALSGDSEWLPTAEAKVLHTPPEGSGGSAYAMGWMIDEIEGVICHHHAGSGGTFYAVICLMPGTGRVVAVAMNDGSLSNDPVAWAFIRWAQQKRE